MHTGYDDQKINLAISVADPEIFQRGKGVGFQRDGSTTIFGFSRGGGVFHSQNALFLPYFKKHSDEKGGGWCPTLGTPTLSPPMHVIQYLYIGFPITPNADVRFSPKQISVNTRDNSTPVMRLPLDFFNC
jgi:hypothetical protein